VSTDFNFNENPELYGTMADNFVAAFKRFEKFEFDMSEFGTTIIIPIKKKQSPFRIVVNRVTGDLHIEMNENPPIEDYSDLFDYGLMQSVLMKFHYMYDDWPTEGICQWTRYKLKDTELKNEISDSFNSSLLSYDADGVISMIDFLVDTYGDDILSKILQDMAPFYEDELDYEGLSARNAIQKNTDHASSWLTDYYLYLMNSDKWRNRLESKISSFPNYWSDMAASETLIENTTDEVSWTASYDDLSAKLFRVALASNLNDNSSLEFITEGGFAEISILKFRNNIFELISTSEVSAIASDIKELATEGFDLYVLIANTNIDPQGINRPDIKLTIEQSQKPIITRLSIHLRNIDVNIKRYFSGGSIQDTEKEISNMSFYTVGDPAPPPTFEDNVFYQAYSFVDEMGIAISGNISVEFNENLDRVLSFSAEHNIDRSVIDPRSSRIEKSISGHDLPMANHANFQVFGLITCDILNNNLKYSEKTHGGTVGWEAISIKGCRPANDDEPSILTIAITKN